MPRPLPACAMPVIATLLAALPPAAEAQTDLGFGTLTGYAELEYLFEGDDDETFLHADLAFSTRTGAFGAAPSLGFDAAVRATASEDDRDMAVYAALTWTTGFGKVSVGIPRPVFTDMIRFPPIGGIRFFEASPFNMTQSLAETVYLTGDTAAPVGLRYDGRFGDLSIGLSWHHFDEDVGAEADITDLVLRYGVEAFGVYAAAEHLDTGFGFSATDYIVGAEADFSGGSAPVRAGLAYFDRNTFLTGLREGWRGYVTYMPTDRIDLTGSLMSIDGDALYGLDMRYRFHGGAYAELGAADGDGGDAIYNLSVGWTF
ncbi:MAG: hypothetical protein N2Z62_14710 [Rhodobacteraceae bacterium]|nr:hypothetical protein [Paracoccaceae bacterium]